MAALAIFGGKKGYVSMLSRRTEDHLITSTQDNTGIFSIDLAIYLNGAFSPCDFQ
jgi:hypothetical protein